jgi:hypothetical protein
MSYRIPPGARRALSPERVDVDAPPRTPSTEQEAHAPCPSCGYCPTCGWHGIVPPAPTYPPAGGTRPVPGITFPYLVTAGGTTPAPPLRWEFTTTTNVPASWPR